MNQQIFVQIASYRDPELLPTIRDCINKAAHPENLTFGVCWQHDSEDSLEEIGRLSNVTTIDVPWEQSKGVCWARSLIQKLWTTEKYTLQLDSHHRFAMNWDTQLIEMFRQTGSEKPLLGSYGGNYNPKTNKVINHDPYIMVADKFNSTGNLLFKPGRIPNWKTLTSPVRARFVSGHYYFTLGIHCQECPYDPSLYFTGEEETLSLRSYTLGYDLFHPHRLLIWHEYTREGRTKHWTDHDEKLKEQNQTDLTWWERDLASKKRVRKLLCDEDNGSDLDVYTLGTSRSRQDYERYTGLDFLNQRMQNTTSKGVEPPSVFIDADTWEASFLSEYCIKIKWKATDITSCTDYIFWALNIEDSTNKLIFRDDIIDTPLGPYFSKQKLDKVVTFSAASKPFRAILWPYSNTQGWLSKIEILL